MCATCGCSEEGHARIVDMDADHGHQHHEHHHHHDHGHEHSDPHEPTHDSRVVRLEKDVLEKNARLAERNRGWLDARGVVMLNLMSAPGAGKTTLLERTIRDLAGHPPVAVIEGDQATLRDAERIRATGGRAVQINTGSGCHLDAAMVAQALHALDPAPGTLLMVENVGNLVCPALFDLGERARIALVSVTEGEDKPLKYPYMFRAADCMLLTKTDLLPHVGFDRDACRAAARRVHPGLPILELSATSGDGLDAWYAWLRHPAAWTVPPATPEAYAP